MLATSPDQFAGASQFDKMKQKDFANVFRITDERVEYAMTNFGLHIKLPMLPIESFARASSEQDDYLLSVIKEEPGKVFVAYLACVHGPRKDYTWIYLRHSIEDHPGHYVRLSMDGSTTSHGKLIKTSDLSIREVFITDNDPSIFNTFDTLPTGVCAREFVVDISGCGSFKVVDRAPTSLWSDELVMETKAGDKSTHGVILLWDSTTGEAFAAIFGVYNSRLWSDITMVEKNESADMLLDRYDHRRWKDVNSHLRGLDWVKKPRKEKPENSILMTLRKQYANADNKATYAVKIVER